LQSGKKNKIVTNPKQAIALNEVEILNKKNKVQ